MLNLFSSYYRFKKDFENTPPLVMTFLELNSVRKIDPHSFNKRPPPILF